MGKAKRKPHPAVPSWVYVDRDNCWWCPYQINQRGCGNCKANKRFVAKQKEKEKRKPIDFE